ncbi:MAG: hypothetical protein AMXMBFR47_34130 [Planctomycetota bacterium]
MRLSNLIGLAPIAICSAALAQAPVGTSFSYQGQLSDGASLANGPYDFIFRLYDASSAGAQVGSSVTLPDRVVSDGLFTVQLDFGASPFSGDARWLDIQVRPGASTGAYTLLTPRQPLTAIPYALFALSGPGAAGAWAASGNNIYATNTGNVGIGSTNPLVKLHVTGGTENTALNDGTVFIQSPGGFLGQIMTMDGNEINGWSQLHLNPEADTNIYMVAGGGNVGIGSAAPAVRLHVEGGTDTELGSGGFLVLGSIASTNMSIDNNEIEARNNGAAATLSLNNDGGDVVIAPQGTTRVRVLEITGADLAEKFPVSDIETPQPGMVLMIDAANPGKLCLAKGAYNRCVAGVVSGANGLLAGSILGHLPGNEAAPAMALSGRVWVWCDATEQAIGAGDMLTTSETPGHAMAATDASRSHGAVIGKAMTTLTKGERGMVLVLVNLQ